MRYHRFDFPDLPLEAFKHYGDRRIKPQGGGGGGGFLGNPLGTLVDTASDIVNGASDTLHQVTAPILDPVSKAVADVGQGVSDVIHDVSTTVAKSPILNTAAYAIMVANGVPPVVASGVLSANAGASPENIVKNMALAGIGSEIAKQVAPEISKLSESQLFGQAAGQAAGSATTASLTGKDPLAAALTSFASSGANVASGEIVKDIPGFDNLPKTAQDSVRAAVSASLQGKDPTMAAVNKAMNAGVQEAVKYGTNIFNGSVTNIDQADFGTNQGAVDKVAAEQAQNDFYESIGINPDTVKDTTPATTDVVDQLVNSGLQETPPTIQDLINPIGDLQTKVSGIQNNLDAQAQNFMDQLQKQGYSYQDALTAATQEMGDRVSGVQTQLGGLESKLDTQAKDFMSQLEKQGYSYQDALNAATQEMGDRVYGVQTQLGGLESKLDAQSKSFMDQLQSQGYSYQDALTAATQEMGDRISGLQTQFEGQLNDYGKSTMDALQKQGLSYTDALNAAMQQQNEAFNSQFSTLDAQNQQFALDLVKQGYTYDEALQGAMQSQAEQLASVQSGLNTQIGNVQTGLNTQIGNVQSNLGSQINKVGSTVSNLQKQVQTQAAAQQQQNQLQSLLSLMALSQPQQQQLAMQDPYAKIKSFQGDLFGEDISTDFLGAATGGSVDDLLRLLRS